jgi:uncharacterized membrane protein
MVCASNSFFSGTFWNAAFLVQGPMIRLTSLVAIVYLATSYTCLTIEKSSLAICTPITCGKLVVLAARMIVLVIETNR